MMVPSEVPPNKSSNFTKYSIIIFLSLSLSLLLVSICGSPISKYHSSALLQGQSSQAVKETSGKQPIQAGCVNIYGSDFNQYPNTDALVVCENIQLTTAQIDAYGFAPTDRNHGITYIETVLYL